MLIGLCGYARSGKDSVAQYLKEYYGFEQTAFANALKRMALAIDPYVHTTPIDVLRAEVAETIVASHTRLSELIGIVGWEKAKMFYDVRRLLQRIGTEGGREILGQNIWVETLLRTVDSVSQDVVVSDVRFFNEERAIRANGGQVWRVTRPNFDNGVSQDHESERYAMTLPVDLELVNDGTLKDLYRQIDDIMAGTRHRKEEVSNAVSS